MVYRELLGRRLIDKKIERNLKELSLIPSKYFEALYIERRTEIISPVFDLLEEEEKEKRGELIELLKEGIVDTKIEIAKYGLYERMVDVTSSMKEVRILMTENVERIKDEEYKELVNILKDVSKLGKIMFQMVENLYKDYNVALEKFGELKNSSEIIINSITQFRFLDDKMITRYNLEDPKVLISNGIRECIQSMMNVGEKIVEIIEEFKFNS
ncbi:MAG: hypothetical protein HGN29_08510 [Asgard group archaeon]|nr:hypothetical protein [Asgard group archaeon]